MDPRTLLVTYDVDERRRRTVETELPAGIEARFLDDVDPDRHAAAVAAADAILTLDPERELAEGAFDAIGPDHLVQTVSAGVDHLPLDRFDAGVTLCSNAGGYAEAMAEHVLAMYLALSKRLLIEHRNLEAGEWNHAEPTRAVAGSTCAVVGLGGVGEASARLLGRLGVEVLAVNRRGETDIDVDFVGPPSALEAVLRRADGVVLAAPLTPETEGLIDAEALSWLADDGMLINVGRGELVVQDALYEHLREHPTFQAGLDVWWDEPGPDEAFSPDRPLLELPNVLGSPHNSGNARGSRERGQRRAVRNVVAGLLGDGPAHVVDPEAGY